MLRRLEAKRPLLLFFLMLTFVVFASPQWSPSSADDAYILWANMEDDGASLDVLVVDDVEDGTVAAVSSKRLRYRSLSVFELFSIYRTTAVGFLPSNFFFAGRFPAFNSWNRLIGYVFAAAPHADMVARK